jgi:hypothetical protein
VSQLETLMARRAALQHELELLRTRGRLVGARTETVQSLARRIDALTLQINMLEARRRRSRDEAVEVNPHSRSRAKAVRRSAMARFSAALAQDCARCRRASMAMSSQQSLIRRECWPPIGWPGVSPICRDFDTDPGDEIHWEAFVRRRRPGLSIMEVSIFAGGRSVFSKHVLGTVCTPSVDPAWTFNDNGGFVSPGGTVRVCAYTQFAHPWCWDEHAEGKVCVKHLRRKPNLVAQGPHIWWDEQWVGFGYRVENNRIYRGSPNCGLYYARRQAGAPDSILRAIRDRSIVRDEGANQNWDNSPGDFRVPFAQMGIPPDEATHMVTVVDINKTVDETNEDDNIAWHELPPRAGMLEWKDTKLVRVPASVPRGQDDPISVRQMKIYELRLRARQEFWGQLVAARPYCSLRVFVSSDRAFPHRNFRGWIFPPSMREQLARPRIDIGQDVRIAENHPPVNDLREALRPEGCASIRSPYLYVPCSQLDPATGELSLLYIPSSLKGNDTIRVELWDDTRNAPIAPIDGREVSISRTIETFRSFSLTWLVPPPATVRATVLLKKKRQEHQPHRFVEPRLVKAKVTVNGRPVGSQYAVRVSVRPLREEIPGSGQLLTMSHKPRSWIFPERYRRNLAASRLKVRGDGKANIAGVTEPVEADSMYGATNKKFPFQDFKLGPRGEVPFWILPPEMSGTDEIRLELIEASDVGKRVATGFARLSTRVRILRHKIPLVFVPGIMGSRLNIGLTLLGVPYTVRWDVSESSITNSSAWAVIGLMASEKIRAMLHASNSAEVLEQADWVDGEESQRGYAGLFSGYINAVRMLHANRFAVEPFEFGVHGAGYDFRRSNIASGAYLAGKVSSILSREQDELGAAQWFVLVTHSMGGLASRSMLRQFAELRERCLAAVHGFQPVTGAPLAFRRMFTGYTNDTGDLADRILGSILGGSPRDFVHSVSGAQGAFDLLPSRQYPTSWFEISEGDGVVARRIQVSPQEMPAIYNSDDSRYGLLSRRGLPEADAGFMRSEIQSRVQSAAQLHELLAGNDGPFKLEGRTWSVYGGGLATDVGAVFHEDDTAMGEVPEGVVAKRASDGDGTVPAESGTALFPSETGYTGGTMPSEAVHQLRVDGRTHQEGWDDPDARRFALRAIRFAVAGVADPRS